MCCRNYIEEERDKLVAALTPSSETKAEYIGEFYFWTKEWCEECEQMVPVKVVVPWDTVKDIMKAIRKMAGVK